MTLLKGNSQRAHDRRDSRVTCGPESHFQASFPGGLWSGGVSSGPGHDQVVSEDELRRLQEIMQSLSQFDLCSGDVEPCKGSARVPSVRSGLACFILYQVR